MSAPSEELLTAEEAAARLRVTRSYLYRLIRRGLLPEAVGIRSGREVKLIPASALERLDAHEGLLVRDVGDQPQAATQSRPFTDPSVTAARRTEGSTAGSLTGQSPDVGAQLDLISQLRAELGALRQQLAEERAARQQLEAKLGQAEPGSGELASAISRANEVTALIKASDLKQQRLFETLLTRQRWGRAKQIAYFTYLAVTSAAGIAILIWIYKLAAHFQAFLQR